MRGLIVERLKRRICCRRPAHHPSTAPLSTGCDVRRYADRPLELFACVQLTYEPYKEQIWGRPLERLRSCYLQQHDILHQQRFCTCANQMAVRWRRGDRQASWRRPRYSSRKELCVRKATWLEGTKLELSKVVLFLFFWSKEKTSVKFCERALGTGKDATVEWKKSIAKIVARSVLSGTIVLGGPGLTVEIDESVFSKRKGNVGRRTSHQWILGAMCRETDRCFVAPVRDMKARTLIPLIRGHVRRGSTIVTDGLRSYACLPNQGYQHLAVNHSANFVDFDSGANTQKTESLWAQLKRRSKACRGTRRSTLWSDLDGFMWRRRLRAGEDPFLWIMEYIAALSPSPR